jgi:tetratricopeptide (TPR) repeat protein
LILCPALARGDELTKLDLDRLFSDLYLMEGEKRVEAGELPQGRFFLKESANKNPLNARAYNLAGIVEVRAGRMEAAEIYFLLATTADPECSECRQNLGNAFLAGGKPDLALIAFYRVLLDESYHTPWLPLYGSGMAYLKKGNYDRAVEMFERVLKYFPAGLDGEVRAKINRALYLKNRKEITKR